MKPSDYMIDLCGALKRLDENEILTIADEIRETQRHGKRVFICGNGGSAATADHFTLDLQKNVPGGVGCISLNSTAAITAYANDVEYKDIYKCQLEKLSQPHDLLIAISTSGRSLNVIRAAGYAKGNMMRVITLTGFPGEMLAEYGHLNIVTMSQNIGIVEDSHTAILHAVIDYLKNGGD